MEKRHSKTSEFSEKLIRIEGLQDSKIDEKRKSSKSSAEKIVIVPEPDVHLTEDIFGLYYDENGNSHNIQRFTWRNKNKIQVQVINYGARITSIKLPDRKGETEDIVLGFDDLAGYIYNKKHFFGATIGRMTNIVRNSTFEIDNKQYWLTQNHMPDHFHGGARGFDQVVWKTYIDDKKVIMSHVSPHMTEGYPGDLLVRVIFELSARNEFNIQMEAQCTQPTVVNLSNLTYFNLAGHYAGADHIYRHIVTINSNCFTPQKDGIPSGEIMNVVHTDNDFQIPKVLGKVMGIVPRDGFNQNLCVNRGADQADCFVARVLHPPSGRMLEVYSNQPGVNFSTADEFGHGRVLSMQELMPEDEIAPPDPILALFEKVHRELMLHLAIDEKGNYEQIRDLIIKIREKAKAMQALNNTPDSGSASTLRKCSEEDFPPYPRSPSHEEEEFFEEEEQSCASELILTPLQLEYLQNTFKIVCDAVDEDDWLQLKEVMKTILDLAIVDEERFLMHDQEGAISQGSMTDTFRIPSKLSTATPPKKKKKPIKENMIPFFYKSTEKIVGKERANYNMHAGIALQTQNYPACANYRNFPNCVLRPGETYKHTLTYKFWVRAGNPNKWIKRNMNLHETKKYCL